MFKFIKAITTTFLSCFFILTVPVQASINNTTVNADEVLLKSGAPIELVERLSDLEKKDIASFIEEGKAIFSGSETSSYYVDEESGELKLIDPKMKAEISAADLKFSKDVWTSTVGSTSGNTYVTGTYDWLKTRPTIKEHLFTISMPSGWSVDSSTVRKVTWYRHDSNISQWTIMDNVAGRSFSSSENSVTWSSLANTSLVNNPCLYRGSCSFVAVKKNSSAANQVKLQYGYSGGLGAIGVSYGPFGVTYTGSSNVNQASQTFNF